MADNVETFTFDSSQAQAELRKLDTVIDVVNGSIQEFNRTASKTATIDPFSKLSSSVQQYAAVSEKRLRKVESLLLKQNQALKQQGTQWKTLTNIVKGFVVTRVLTEATQLFFRASEAAEEFQITLARIDGIASDINLDQLEEQLEGITVTLGQDLGSVSQAALEAFQNDLGTTAETVTLLGGAMTDLATVTGGTLVQSVNTLTPIIKAYGLELSEAEQLSAQLFNAIDNGVITLEQLEGQMGSVVPLANQLGVGIEEVFAAIATGTLAGVDTAKSITQLRNVMVKLTKPTEELKVAFRELGVASFKELQENSDGLRDAIDKIFTALDRDPERFARAFNTIRGQLGAINIQLTNAGQSEFDRIMEESAGSSEKLADALAKIRATDAFKQQQQAAQFNIILTDLGETALKVRTQLQGMLLNFIPDAKTATAAITGLGLATTAYAATSVAATTAAGLGYQKLAVQIGALGGPLALAAALGAVAGVQISKGIDVLSERIEFAGVQVDELVKKSNEVELFKKLETKRLKDLEKEIGNVENALNGVDPAAQKAFLNISARALIAGDSIAGTFDAAIENFEKGGDKLLAAVEKAFDGVEDEFQSAKKEFEGALQDLDDFRFEKSLKGLDDNTVAAKRLERATKQIVKVGELVGRQRAGDLSITREMIDAEAELAKKYGEAAESAADKAGNDFQAAEAIRIQDSAMFNLAQTAGEFLDQKDRARKIPLIDRQRAIKDFADIKNRLVELQELFKFEGGGEGIKQIEENLDTVKTKGAAIIEELKEVIGSDLFRDLGFAEEGNQLVSTFEKDLNSIVIDWTENRERLRAELAAADFQASVDFVTNAQDIAAGSGNSDFQKLINDAVSGGGTAPEQQGAVNNAIGKTILDLEKQQSELTSLEKGYEVFEGRVEENFRRLNNGAFKDFFANVFSSPKELEASGQAIANYVLQFEQLFNEVGNSSREQAIEVRNGIGATLNQLRQDNQDGIIPNQRYKQLADQGLALFDLYQNRLEQLEKKGKVNPELLEDLKDFKQTSENLRVDPEVETQGVKELDRTLDGTKQKASETSNSVAAIGPGATRADGAARILDSTLGSMGTSASNSKSAVDALAQSLRDAAEAQRDLNAAQSGGGGGGPSIIAYRGGKVNYRAAGGASRGQDTVPAQLTPGEFVVNPQSSRNFFSQLQAINAGSNAASGGGGDTTINVGDINVSSTSQLPNETARQVGQSIKRELRRRTFKL